MPIDPVRTRTARPFAVAIRRNRRATPAVPGSISRGRSGEIGSEVEVATVMSSPKPAIDVVSGPWVLGVGEDVLGLAGLDDVARSPLFGQKERALLGHARSLLHVVRDDHDGHLVAQDA